jgi:uncharacterized small protein (DUF1192 family)
MDSSLAVNELGYSITPLQDGIARVVAQVLGADDGQSGRRRA